MHRMRFAARERVLAPSSSVSTQTSHKADQTLDLFLGEIRVRRHGAAFSDSRSSALDHRPDPVIRSVSLPISVGQILWLFS